MSGAGTNRATKKRGEEGYVLVAVIFLLAVLVITMAVAVPKVKEEIQRDREVETMHRGKQYARAIKLYYKKFSAYPPNMDALVMTNNIRFLRKKYTDPMTGKADWKPIMFGQNKAPLAMGFFGQPLGGASASLAGTGPSGGNGIQGTGTSGSSFGGNSNGSTFGSGSSFSNGSTFSNGNSLGNSGSGSGSIFGQDNSGQNSGSNGTTGQSGSSGSGGSTGGFGSSASLSSTQTFGGGGIIGFEPASDKQSILFYKKKNHYNEWEFTYSPIADQMMSGGNLGTIGTPAGGSSNTFGGSTGTFGGSTGQTGIGGGSTGSGTGINAPAPTAPTTPQQ